MVSRLKELRKEKKATLADIEKETGIKRSTYSDYENGVVTTGKIATWQKLADFFDVDVAYLQGTSEVKNWRKYEHNQNSLVFGALNDASFGVDLEQTLLTEEDKTELRKTISELFETVIITTEKDAKHNELSLEFSRKLIQSISSVIFLYKASLNIDGNLSDLQNKTIKQLMDRLDYVSNMEYPYELPEILKNKKSL
ncbi:helix-turn-helix domain-containing protein [Fructobacillus fructosus]|uniref:helix-turn-helix domain-containing protein n=1 Tax=Fructobacillus fructosus TaxID=1631 RepID=UPI0016588DC8|nr:helix-turn-helix transcriptional regulator [Fructobacillus fructosus]MBC9119410.1 helix-turn-helix transcriptional regulator [Fructobacillus fructosus]MBD9366935.1 helix-turn-helix transcriptional regulator [Leuconostoc mesenteroides]